MNGWTYACLVVGLLFLAAPAGALIPDDVEITTNPEWLTAGSGGFSTVTVLVTNGTSASPVSGAVVDLAVDSVYGSISSTHLVTGSDGKATATFRHGTRSGTATITATVSREGMEPLNGSGEQKIDHATAHKVANLWYDPEVTAGGKTNITVRMVDRYGNLVDGRNVAEEVTFMASPPAGFVDGESLADALSVPVDDAGNVTTTLRVDTLAGGNIVLIQPPSPLGLQSFTITGVGGLPADIKLEVDPLDASVPADGDKVIEFTYTLIDKYGNPTAGQGFWVNASIQRGDRPAERQDVLLYSNRYGQVLITYGPEDSVGIATITATAAANASVSVSQDVVFTSTDPTNMLLTASPQTMPSRDVKTDTVSQIRAKVMDVKGNPVEGERVEFEIVSGSVNFGEYNQTEEPYLDAESAWTDANGYALVRFHPGAFTTDPDAPNWNDAATGTATVRATWNGTTRTIPLTWKNYPYLSVETEVSPETVAVNDTVDVTIRLKGDGWALQPDPIDVVLVIDRSSSMTGTDVHPSRINAAKSAAQIFVGQMNQDRDRIGLVSYYAQTSKDLPLTDDYSRVNSTIQALKTGTGTGTRKGLYIAIQEMTLNNNSNPDAVRAVILMTDGEYNYYGDPLARGNGDTKDFFGWDPSKDYTKFPDLGGQQNLAAYAKNNGTQLYMISFSNSIVNGSHTWNTLETLARETGGKHYHANTGTDLAQVYTDIAGELKTEAGVDTEMDIAFENVNVTGVDLPGADVFDYVYDPGNSTYICNQTGFEETIDQRSQWNSGQKLHFEIGTIRLGQTWETTFRLKVKEDGNINIFGDGSTITFNNGTDSLELPDTFITAVPDLNNTGLTNRWLEVDLADPVTPAGEDTFIDTVPLNWAVTYNGTQDIDKALAYSSDNGLSWTVFWTKTVDRSTTQGEARMDVSSLPAGEYQIRLVASALDAPEARDTTDVPIQIGNTSRAYIKIE